DRKIAVEIKTFGGISDIHDLELALGQYRLYRYVLARRDPERLCYVALTETAYTDNFFDVDAQDLIPAEDLRLIVFDPVKETILRWIPQ
ncbi:MAG TPA: element excision factor XisH family protein, partial [Chthonomonadaceae bacterium]|nr:element excision factor XisH family protein [Chthonomonadaceae bacterium]